MGTNFEPIKNRLVLGDNLELLRKLPDESVDLVYLDPPFFSNRHYETVWGDKQEVRSFEDRWSGGIERYIDWLKERVAELHRLLKPTGSIFLHCDWHANSYIRVYILDKLFGQNNFVNEFVWKRSTNRSSISKSARKNYDTIFYYTKSDNYTFNQIFVGFSKNNLALYKFEDEKGKYRLAPLMGSGKRNGKTGAIWRDIDPNRHGKEGMHWITIPEKLEEYCNKDLVYFPQKGGVPMLKYYLSQSPGVPLSEVWDDINNVRGSEAIGYPTQKPEALLERIIQLASNVGDVVLDPFMGGGTTVVVADRLRRRWIGIDIAPAAISVAETRLEKQSLILGFDALPYVVQLQKYDYATLRNMEAYEFQSWIIIQYGGVPFTKKGPDKGVDGKKQTGEPIQVKRSDNVGDGTVKHFSVSSKQYDRALFERNVGAGKPVGTIIAFSFTKAATQEAYRLKLEEGIIIDLKKVEDIVALSSKPELKLEINCTQNDDASWTAELLALCNSPAGINSYAWDFNYDKDRGFNPEVLLDKEGRQVRVFDYGKHIVAVRVVDNDGLCSMETQGFTINGGFSLSGFFHV